MKRYINSTNGVTILKPVPIKLKPSTKVSQPSSNNPSSWNNSQPVVDKTPEKSTIPSIYTNNAATTVSKTSSSSSNTSSSSGFSISGIVNTAESDFSKYFDYILIGGAIILVFYMFSGSSSSNSQTKFVDIKIPE